MARAACSRRRPARRSTPRSPTRCRRLPSSGVRRESLFHGLRASPETEPHWWWASQEDGSLYLPRYRIDDTTYLIATR